MEYVRTHWRGEHSLARSFWINNILFSLVIFISFKFAENPISTLNIRTLFAFVLVYISCLAIITTWQLVGIWRSATNHLKKTGRWFWADAAKWTVVIGALGTTANLGTLSKDVISTLVVLNEPRLSNYTIERSDDKELIFTGAINSESVSELISVLKEPAITILRINSQGGLLDPAFTLARLIQRRELMVIAESQCVSACVILLAGSPSAAIYPGSLVAFHRFEPVTEFSNLELRREAAVYRREAEAIYREFGIAEWAIKTTRRLGYWTPTLNQMIQMNLIKNVYAPDLKNFLTAEDYCNSRPNECSQ